MLFAEGGHSHVSVRLAALCEWVEEQGISYRCTNEDTELT